jgi:hypothetical protein
VAWNRAVLGLGGPLSDRYGVADLTSLLAAKRRML